MNRPWFGCGPYDDTMTQCFTSNAMPWVMVLLLAGVVLFVFAAGLVAFVAAIRYALGKGS